MSTTATSQVVITGQQNSTQAFGSVTYSPSKTYTNTVSGAVLAYFYGATRTASGSVGDTLTLTSGGLTDALGNNIAATTLRYVGLRNNHSSGILYAFGGATPVIPNVSGLSIPPGCTHSYEVNYPVQSGASKVSVFSSGSIAISYDVSVWGT